MTTSRIATLAAVLAALAASPSLFADCTTPVTHTVTSPNDDGAPGTLRFLVNSASVQDCDTIEIPPMLIVFDGANNDIEIDKSITIRGAGADQTIIDGNGTVTNDRVFEVDFDSGGPGNGVHVTFEGLTIRNGNANQGGGDDDGGGILARNEGSVAIVNCAIIGNHAEDDGGGVQIARNVSDPDGGLVITGSTFSENTADNNGGGIGAYYTGAVIHDSIVSKNVADFDDNGNGGGGGIWIDDGGTEIFNTKIVENTSKGSTGGGLYAEYGAFLISNCEISGNTSEDNDAGGIYNGYEMLIENSVISNNRALSSGGDGGGIFNDDFLKIVDSLVENNDAENEGGGIFNDDSIIVQNTTISGNVSDVDDDGSGDGGGGIYNNYTLSLVGSLVQGNTANAGSGGGLYLNDYALIENSSIVDNTAIGDGSDLGDGGGIHNTGDPMILKNSTVAGNSALGNDGSDDSRGGGIWNDDSVLIINSTIADNRADGHGGGIYNEYDIQLNQVTVAFNTADANAGEASSLTNGDGGGVYNEAGNNIVLNNTIIAGNVDASAGAEAPDCFSNFSADDSSITPLGPNLIQNDDGCEILGDSASVIHADPQFDATGLTDNGGPDAGDPEAAQPIATISLQSSSPAVDAGNDATCATSDERGEARPTDGNGDGEARCDLGALEAASSGGTTGGGTGGETTGGETTGGTTGGDGDSGGCSLIR